MRISLALTLLIFLTVPLRLSGENLRTEVHLDQIHRLLAETWRAYEAGDPETAFRLARSAYLDHFELVEIPLRLVDAELTLDMEYRFARLRNRIRMGAPAPEVRRLIASLDRDLLQVAKKLEKPGVVAPLFTALSSFAVLFREGVEAFLILSLLLAFLQHHDPRLRRPLLWGAVSAVPAGLLTWALMIFFLRVAGVAREIMEGIVALLAAVLLVYVTLWVLRRLDLRHWMEFLRARAWEATAVGSAGALAGLGFLSVYREVVETALFYQTLSWMTEGMTSWLWTGAGLGAVALTITGWAIFSLGRKLPLRPFLVGAATVMMVLSLGIVGNAVRAFQSAGWLPFSPWTGVFPKLNPFVADLLGLYPVRETLWAQALLLAVYLAFGLGFFLKKRRAEAVAREQEAYADRR